MLVVFDAYWPSVVAKAWRRDVGHCIAAASTAVLMERIGIAWLKCSTLSSRMAHTMLAKYILSRRCLIGTIYMSWCLITFRPRRCSLCLSNNILRNKAYVVRSISISSHRVGGELWLLLCLLEITHPHRFACRQPSLVLIINILTRLFGSWHKEEEANACF